MASIDETIDAWKKYIDIKVRAHYQSPEKEAGNKAEEILRKFVTSHPNFRGCYSFPARRVPDLKAGHKREIDVIVVTDKRLYLLECKNWSGTLVADRNGWLQYPRASAEKPKPDPKPLKDFIQDNRHKTYVLLQYLADRGIYIEPHQCVQRVIFMNRNLEIRSPEIARHPDVVQAHELGDFLDAQQGINFSMGKKLFEMLISIVLSEDNTAKIVDGLFKRLGKENHKRLIAEINQLPTWDKLAIFGTAIEAGDVFNDRDIALHDRIEFSKVKHIRVRVDRDENRGRALAKGIAKSLLGFRAVGLDCYDARGKLIQQVEGNPRAFLNIKVPAPGGGITHDLPLLVLDEISYGKIPIPLEKRPRSLPFPSRLYG